MNNLITPDQAKARATIVAMTAMVDVRDWERVAQCFADRLTLDYTSLWGGEPQEMGREELVAQWQALVPGFDATWHELGRVAVSIRGDEADSEASIVATHLLDGSAWIVEGRYRCHLVRRAESWQITALACIVDQESGDRALTERAKERAAA